MSAYIDEAVDVALAELARFGEGKLEEGDEDVYLRVGDYWESIPVKGINGRTKVKDSKGRLYNPAWSAAFISYVVRAAGAGSSFLYTQAHCHYVEKARQAAKGKDTSAAYYAVEPQSAKPAVGDIVCAGREYAKAYTFKQAELVYKADTFYPSHGDLVVAVHEGFIQTIGGNVNNSVRRKKILLDSSGILVDRVDGAQVLPWLALLKCRL